MKFLVEVYHYTDWRTNPPPLPIVVPGGYPILVDGPERRIVLRGKGGLVVDHLSLVTDLQYIRKAKSVNVIHIPAGRSRELEGTHLLHCCTR